MTINEQCQQETSVQYQTYATIILNLMLNSMNRQIPQNLACPICLSREFQLCLIVDNDSDISHLCPFSAAANTCLLAYLQPN